jgi:hypothetical protein
LKGLLVAVLLETINKHDKLNCCIICFSHFSGLLFFPTAKLGVNGDPSQQEGQQQQQHKSFFVRYWYIILPLFIMTCLTSGEEPPPPTSSSSTAARSATSTNTATGTSTTTGSAAAHVVRTAVAPSIPQPKTTASVKRRGKRD